MEMELRLWDVLNEQFHFISNIEKRVFNSFTYEAFLSRFSLLQRGMFNYERLLAKLVEKVYNLKALILLENTGRSMLECA